MDEYNILINAAGKQSGTLDSGCFAHESNQWLLTDPDIFIPKGLQSAELIPCAKSCRWVCPRMRDTSRFRCIMVYPILPKKTPQVFPFSACFFRYTQAWGYRTACTQPRRKGKAHPLWSTECHSREILEARHVFFQWPACCLVPLFLRGWWQQNGRNAWTNGHQLCPNIGHLTSCAKNSNICVESRQY